MATGNSVAPRLSDQAAVTLQNAAAATGNGAALALDGTETEVLLTVTSTGPAVGTLTLEHSIGGAFVAASVNLITTLVVDALTIVNPAAGPVYYRYHPVPGATQLRARVSAYTSGTITVTAISRKLT